MRETRNIGVDILFLKPDFKDFKVNLTKEEDDHKCLNDLLSQPCLNKHYRSKNRTSNVEYTIEETHVIGLVD